MRLGSQRLNPLDIVERSEVTRAPQSKIGILAYGSLIDSAGVEIARATVDKTTDVLTPFKVEFARSSSSRAGAPTLVPFASGAAVKGVIFRVTLDRRDAIDALYRRETDQVGSGKRYRHPQSPGPNTVLIDELEEFCGYDVVISTRIAANIEPLLAVRLADLAVQSARQLKNGRDGISYLLNAKNNGIVTPLSPAYEAAVLQQLRARSLDEALTKTRL